MFVDFACVSNFLAILFDESLPTPQRNHEHAAEGFLATMSRSQWKKLLHIPHTSHENAVADDLVYSSK